MQKLIDERQKRVRDAEDARSKRPPKEAKSRGGDAPRAEKRGRADAASGNAAGGRSTADLVASLKRRKQA